MIPLAETWLDPAFYFNPPFTACKPVLRGGGAWWIPPRPKER